MTEAAHILLVEDDDSHAELVRRAFEGHERRFRLSVVGSVEQARRAAESSAPDLMITDLKLPDGRGIELVPPDRDAARFAVVVMTSHGDESVAVEAMKSGALDYVVKDERLLAEMPRIAERALREWRHITDKRRAEQELDQRDRELRHAQKMEAIGRLASGVAHDFNNVLTGIIGCADVALSQLPTDSKTRPLIEEIRSSARGAASIAGRLLAFARPRELESETLDIDQTVLGVQTMLRQLLGSDIELAIDVGAPDARVRIDRGELDQIIMNLAVNARDAMPAGGRLSISTRNVEVPASAKLAPGQYVVLRIADTGVGMDEGTRNRAFEPFFTTKEIGKGTGLGLATTYAIIRAAGGCVELESSPGAGTSFAIHLPRVDAKPAEAAPVVAPPRGRGETVLLVEDQPTVRLAMRHYLEQGGYRVLEASDATSATEWCRRPGGHVDLVVTDVVMPGGGGKHVTDSVRSCCPGLPVLYVSAHPAEVLEREGRIEPGSQVLNKPFAPESLLERVHRALPPREPAPRTSAPAVLLVEDHRLARMALAELLRALGFEVIEAATGAEALALLEQRTPDVLFTDLGLPDVDGLELAARVRARNPALPALVASGHRPDDARLDALLAGPNAAFVEKPLEVEIVAQQLDRLLGKP